MPETNIFRSYNPSTVESLAKLYQLLSGEQERTWPRLREGTAALKEVKIRTIHCGGYDVQLQFNPRRIHSTGAKVDADSIRERKCFLCPANLPLEQQGILYKNEFLLLCNPAPIFEYHGTIIHLHHIPQAIETQMEVVLTLAKDLSPSYTLFYNGPKCGASAPDHWHVQASPAGMIPIELESRDPERIELVKTYHNVKLSTMKNYGRGVMMMESDDYKELCAMFLRTVAALRSFLATHEEPPMNIIFSYNQDCWRLIIIPRKKHRPDMYFKDGEERVLISPAAVDIGGLMITPMEKDFERVDAVAIQAIFAEVCYGEDVIHKILDRL
jgi:hypothetical protein